MPNNCKSQQKLSKIGYPKKKDKINLVVKKKFYEAQRDAKKAST